MAMRHFYVRWYSPYSTTPLKYDIGVETKRDNRRTQYLRCAHFRLLFSLRQSKAQLQQSFHLTHIFLIKNSYLYGFQHACARELIPVSFTTFN